MKTATKANLFSIKNAMASICSDFKTADNMDLAITLIQNILAVELYTDPEEKDQCRRNARELLKRCRAIAPQGSNFIAEIENCLSRIVKGA